MMKFLEMPNISPVCDAIIFLLKFQPLECRIPFIAETFEWLHVFDVLRNKQRFCACIESSLKNSHLFI